MLSYLKPDDRIFLFLDLLVNEFSPTLKIRQQCDLQMVMPVYLSKEINLELQTGNAPIGSKSLIFWPEWTWNLTDNLEKKGYILYATSIFVHRFVGICEIKLE